MHVAGKVLLALVLALGVLTGSLGRAQAATHHYYVGTITAISYPSGGHTGALTIHSKTHNTNFHFLIASTTRFLRHGQGEPRTSFKVGSYVTVSYSPGPPNMA